MTDNELTAWTACQNGYPVPTTLTSLIGEQNITTSVTFKDASQNVLQKLTIPAEGLTVDTFPTVATSKQVVWINQKTGAVVEAPMTFTEAA